MRIGIDVQPLQTGTRQAGVGRYVDNVLSQLLRAESPHAYTLFLNSADYLAPVDALPEYHARFRVPRKPRLGKFWWVWDTLYLPYALRQQHIDIYHYNSLSEAEPMAPPFPLGRQKVVATVHDVIPLKVPELYPEIGKPSLTNFNFTAKLHRLSHANAIMTVSECSKRDIMNCLHYPEEKIFVTYNGIAPEFFREPAPGVQAALRQHYALPEQFLLYLGGYYSPRKNIERLLDAYRLLLEGSEPQECPPLVLAGLSNHDHKANIQRLLIRKGLTDQARVLPHIPDAELPGLYQLATLFVYPSLYEGFGLPVAEALACGAVVATSKVSSLPEIGGESCLYFNPYDPNAIAETLREGLTNSGRRTMLRQHGPAQVSRFSWHTTAQAILSVYEATYASSKNPEHV